ncbi:cAMP-binding proteins - catabolite gene activator and regulatory subunit of cAMP-dependent protein kinases [Tenacibaculum sp. 190130A14a]|uniref:Cyclic nucleotide-binding domain-containing protein n=1 Tax=Tenacibaculum polynesiense TaxID=3137857 RepID=A0ABM9P666_9FLAO
MERELAIIFKGLSLTSQELGYLSSIFKKETFKKGELILTTEEEVKHQYYVLDGCLRTFFIDLKGKEHTIQFAVNDWWISDYISYFLDEKSVLTIESIKESTLLRVEKEDFEKALHKIPSIEHHIRKKVERFMAKNQKRTLAALSQSAKQRYLNFAKSYASIEKHVKNYHIASYLGITTQSLSRIRKEILKGSGG